MNFFQDQHRARSQTRKLIMLYGLAVIATALACTIVLAIFIFSQTSTTVSPDLWTTLIENASKLSLVFGMISGGIFIVSMMKIYQLGQGGEYVARLAGAVPVDRNAKDLLLRRYINIVEEMSIASGCPIPKIYILNDESNINAFAAGYNIDDCVIAVTRGAIANLTRDELQGVIAHEFSHIFNGDMKLNIKLIGYLAGLIALTELGRVLMRTNRSSNSKKNGGQIALAGLIIFIIGGIGYLAASLIKAMISRQREYLADASAVQFTRNPDGIGGALKKLYVMSGHGHLDNPKTAEVSHMFFTNTLSSLFATHPPLQDRIQRVFPKMKWLTFTKQETKEIENKLETITQDMELEEKNLVNNLVSSLAPAPKSFKQKLKTAGQIQTSSIQLAKALLADLQKEIKPLIDTYEGASSALIIFFLDPTHEHQQKQNQILKAHHIHFEMIEKITPYVVNKDLKYRFPIIELAINTIKNEDDERKKAFVKIIKELIIADGKISANEFVLFQLIKTNLFPRTKFIDKRVLQRDVYRHKKPLIHLCENIAQGEDKKFSPKEISEALGLLHYARGHDKKEIIDEIVATINKDEVVTPAEYEFLQLVCMELSVPIPL